MAFYFTWIDANERERENERRKAGGKNR